MESYSREGGNLPVCRLIQDLTFLDCFWYFAADFNLVLHRVESDNLLFENKFILTIIAS
jgi:hypothetical protein